MVFSVRKRGKIAKFIAEGMKEEGFSLCYIGEKNAAWLDEKFPLRWELCREEESDEYICNISDLVGLSGGKYKGIRHKISRWREKTKTIPARISISTKSACF